MNTNSFYILYKLINFLQKNGKKTKIYLAILFVFKLLSLKYLKTVPIIVYYLFQI